VVKEINEPRLPSLRGKLRARKTSIPVWGPEDLDVDCDEIGLSGSPTYVSKIFVPERKRSAKIFRGEAENAVDQLMQELRKGTVV
jgi:electron transfer flavoprotein beta subunit